LFSSRKHGGEAGNAPHRLDGAAHRLDGTRLMDRRSAHRVAVHLTGTYRSSTTTGEGIITDLSRQGLFFAGLIDQVGIFATVDILLPHARLSVAGRVARRGEAGATGIGLRFDDLGDETRRQIANIVLSAHSAT
jgi:PilZ domain